MFFGFCTLPIWWHRQHTRQQGWRMSACLQASRVVLQESRVWICPHLCLPHCFPPGKPMVYCWIKPNDNCFFHGLTFGLIQWQILCCPGENWGGKAQLLRPVPKKHKTSGKMDIALSHKGVESERARALKSSQPLLERVAYKTISGPALQPFMQDPALDSHRTKNLPITLNPPNCLLCPGPVVCYQWTRGTRLG